MKTPFCYRRPNEGTTSGAALVIVLALLVLVTVSVLIELSVSSSQRSTSDNDASGTSAELVARTAGSLVIGQLAQEIADGSLAVGTGNTITANGYTTYQPTNSFTMRIATNVFSGLAAISPLVKESGSNSYFYYYTNNSGMTNYAKNGVSWASAASTTTASANGHSISLARWNRPLFLPLKTPGSITDFTPTASFTAPDWIYLTRAGPQILTAANLTSSTTAANNPLSSNTNYVIGRFAFTIYDEGGLLDAGAAGYSSASSLSANSDIAPKGSIGLADLTQIPNGSGALKLTQAQADALVNWRNAASESAYTNYLFNQAPVTGYMQPAAGDESFVSRQDLIQFWLSKIATNAPTGVEGLRYFTTFSRTLNSPAWFPEVNAKTLQEAPNAAFGGNTDTKTPPGTDPLYAYFNNENTAGRFNRNFPGVRVVTTTLHRLDGTTASVGEPLVKSRFDLNRLGWITYNGVPPTGVTATDIYNYFGLVWDPGTTDANTSTSAGTWVYNHTSLTLPASPSQTTDIMTLDSVATAQREPDFFELLKAGLIQGSLGLYSGYPDNPNVAKQGGELYRLSAVGNLASGWQAYYNGPSSPTVRVDAQGKLINQMEKYQTIQIGANIIDQYSSDNYPTPVQLNSQTFYGIKNLPYFNSLAVREFRPPDSTILPPPPAATNTIQPNADWGYIHSWIIFSLWNPHMNAGSPSSPTTLRVIARSGQLLPWWFSDNSGPNSNSIPNVSVQARDFSGAPSPATTNGPAWVQFSLADYPNAFKDPTELTTANSPSAQVSDAIDEIPPTIPSPGTEPDFNDIGLYVGWNKSLDSSLPPTATNPTPNGLGMTVTAATNLYAATNYSIPAGFCLLPTYVANGATTAAVSAAAGGYAANARPLNLELQYQDPASTNVVVWRTYQVIPNLILPGPQHGAPYLEPGDPLWSGVPLSNHNESSPGGSSNYFGTTVMPRGAADVILAYLDPRTTRIPPAIAGGLNKPVGTGTVLANSSYLALNFYANSGVGFGPPTGALSAGQFPLPFYGYHAQSTGVIPWNLWDDNFPITSVSPATGTFKNNSTFYYTDRDYVRRPGDSMGYAFNTNYAKVTSSDPLIETTNYVSTGIPSIAGIPFRPIVLSRPFHSVGEMGYAFRDDPWRSLDFFSNKSGDSALLDLFCLGPGSSTSPTNATPSVIAGTVNINSAPLPVLEALLSGAGKALVANSPSSFTSTYTTADINTFATNYFAYVQGTNAVPTGMATNSTVTGAVPITTGPLYTPADLPLALPQVPLYTGSAISLPATNSAFTGVKTQREAPIRALAGTVSTRTWNVLIDVIAQSGRFSPTANSLDQFSDKGERRYWIHVAIDRYTGKIVDEKIEFVSQ